MFNLVPTNLKFFDLFDRETEIIAHAAERFNEFMNKFEHPDRYADEIKGLEHEADEKTHEIMSELHQSFITPLERSDIRRLVEALDDVLDFLDDAARRIVLYDITEPLPEIKELAKVLVQATAVMRTGVGHLRHLRKRTQEILQNCIEIRRLENEGDRINHAVIARLFKSNLEPLTVLKWKEIVVDVETAIDRCQDVANILEGIVLENT